MPEVLEEMVLEQNVFPDSKEDMENEAHMHNTGSIA
jgi:hypothetical protein